MGKSSLLNTLLGRRRVSTSATPGHTKHLQTMHVTKDLVLCDSPGVVHPQVGVPRALQVIFGLYPIAQVREPFTHVRFIAEHCWPPLPAAFGLLHVARQVRARVWC
ncbi:hypothetical protein JKP88DRAFT_172457 [Tribonema minus]|uniref:Guanine nucleotide-binding protein-like 1 n=1 Tax=Tribonema minus TaxID=303371 RepID=A0A835YIT2_9STRA|nr:hypothetical protein JKP88DRAFT_172457 [Tribonema minus]